MDTALFEREIDTLSMRFKELLVTAQTLEADTGWKIHEAKAGRLRSPKPDNSVRCRYCDTPFPRIEVVDARQDASSYYGKTQPDLRYVCASCNNLWRNAKEHMVTWRFRCDIDDSTTCERNMAEYAERHPYLDYLPLPTHIPLHPLAADGKTYWAEIHKTVKGSSNMVWVLNHRGIR